MKDVTFLQKIKEKYKKYLPELSNKNKIVYSTGSIFVDNLLNGGFVGGTIVEIFGHEGAGKTTFLINFIAHNQSIFKKHFFVYIDSEGGLSQEIINKTPLDKSRLLILKISKGEDVFDIVEECASDKLCAGIIVDSIASLITDDEFESQPTLGSHARMLSKRLKKLLYYLVESKSSTTVFLVNQLRSKIGYGEMWKGEMNYTTTGGKAMKYFPSLRLDLSRDKFIEQSSKKIGIIANIKVVKSRHCAPQTSAYYPIIFSEGFSLYAECFFKLYEMKIITKDRGWYSYETVNKFLGLNDFIKKIKENKDLFEKILKHTKSLLLT